MVSPLLKLLTTRSYRADRGENNLARFVDCDLDRLLAELIDSGQIDSQELQSASSKEMYSLFSFSRRAVVLALRDAEQAWVLLAARALGVAAPGLDPRDAQWAASLITAATVDIGFEVASVSSALRTSNPQLARLVESSEERTTRQPDPWQGTMFARVSTSWGVGLVNRDVDSYHPTMDLLGMAMEVGDRLDADRYLADDPTISTHLPSVWLGESTRSEAGLGCASISCVDWERSSRWDRMFTVWIIEAKSEREAGRFARRAAKADGEHARLAITVGKVACIAIARSATVGVPRVETSNSLLRFESPFRKAIAAVIQGTA